MAGKRKLVRQRTTSRKTKSRKTNEGKGSSTLFDYGFTKEEEEEPLSSHIKPSPKKAPKSPKTRTKRKEEEEPSSSPTQSSPKKSARTKNAKTRTEKKEEDPLSSPTQSSPKKSARTKHTKTRKKKSPSVTANDVGSVCNNDDENKDDEPVNHDGKDNSTLSPDNNDGENDDENENENQNQNENDTGEEHKSKYEVRERVLARDEDGILYYGNIRRKLYGINHQKTISCLGIFDLAPEEITGKDTTTHQQKVQEDNESNKTNNNTTESQEGNEWHYFVHYEGWKTLWDRWIAETDIMDITPDNLERMKEISKSHKAFQLEFKEKTKKKKIQNGGLFLQQWKQRLDALNKRWDEKIREQSCDKNTNNSENDKGKLKQKKQSAANKRKAAAKKKSTTKSPQELLRDRSKLAVQSCLTARQPSHIQAIPLSFGLKRILVEDWENLNNGTFATENNSNKDAQDSLNFDMVHVLPAKVTIRDALTLYLKEKDISWDEKFPKSNKRNEAKANSTSETPSKSDPPLTLDKQTPSASEKNQKSTESSMTMTTNDPSPLPDETISTQEETKIAVKDEYDLTPTEDNADNEREKGISIQLVKEWTDMADGIVLYFEQALMSRLLYPSEISQILVLEDSFLHGRGGNETSNTIEPMPLKADIYGCEHLLRLLASIPRILDQQLQDSRKRKLERKQQQQQGTSKQQQQQQQHQAKPDEDAAVDQDDAFVEIGSMILAKLQDLSRFLQKNQSALFRSMYRKKNEQEIKRDLKIQKRQERRLKSAAAAAAAAAAASSQSIAQNSQNQEE